VTHEDAVELLIAEVTEKVEAEDRGFRGLICEIDPPVKLTVEALLDVKAIIEEAKWRRRMGL